MKTASTAFSRQQFLYTRYHTHAYAHTYARCMRRVISSEEIFHRGRLNVRDAVCTVFPYPAKASASAAGKIDINDAGGVAREIAGERRSSRDVKTAACRPARDAKRSQFALGYFPDTPCVRASDWPYRASGQDSIRPGGYC